MKVIYFHFYKGHDYVGILTKFHQIGIVEDFTMAFEKLEIYIEGFFF